MIQSLTFGIVLTLVLNWALVIIAQLQAINAYLKIKVVIQMNEHNIRLNDIDICILCWLLDSDDSVRNEVFSLYPSSPSYLPYLNSFDTHIFDVIKDKLLFPNGKS